LKESETHLTGVFADSVKESDSEGFLSRKRAAKRVEIALQTGTIRVLNLETIKDETELLLKLRLQLD
jgi:hypothetical protein